MTRRMLAVGSIRAGHASVVTMRHEEPIIVRGDGSAVSTALVGARAVSDLGEVALADYCDRVAALGVPVAVHADGSYTRA